MATRVIKSVGADGYSIGDGESRTLSVASDTGAVSGNYTVTSIKINFDKMRHYSNDYYVIVEIGGKTIGETDRQKGYYDDSSTVSRTMNFDSDVKDDWQKALTATGSITITTVVNSGNGSLNLREGCVVTITVTYEETTPGGSSGGSSGGDDEDLPVIVPEAPWGFRITTNDPTKDTVTLYWNCPSYSSSVIVNHYYINCMDSNDNITWYRGAYEEEVQRSGMQQSYEAPKPAPGRYRKYIIYTGYYITNSQDNVAYRGGSAESESVYVEFTGFTDTPLVAGETHIKALHMTELQEYANSVYKSYALTPREFSTIMAGETSLAGWSAHVNEIRAAVEDLCERTGRTHKDWINLAVNCPSVEIMDQLRDEVLRA